MCGPVNHAACSPVSLFRLLSAADIDPSRSFGPSRPVNTTSLQLTTTANGLSIYLRSPPTLFRSPSFAMVRLSDCRRHHAAAASRQMTRSSNAASIQWILLPAAASLRRHCAPIAYSSWPSQSPAAAAAAAVAGLPLLSSHPLPSSLPPSFFARTLFLPFQTFQSHRLWLLTTANI